MPSAIPAGYVYWDRFGYVRESDKTGPYAIDSGGTPTLIGTPSGPPPEVTGLQFNDAENSMYQGPAAGIGIGVN